MADTFTYVEYVVHGMLRWLIRPTRPEANGPLVFPEGTLPTDIGVTFKGKVTRAGKRLEGSTFSVSVEKLSYPETVIRADANANQTVIRIPVFTAGRHKDVQVLSAAEADFTNALFASEPEPEPEPAKAKAKGTKSS